MQYGAVPFLIVGRSAGGTAFRPLLFPETVCEATSVWSTELVRNAIHPGASLRCRSKPEMCTLSPSTDDNL